MTGLCERFAPLMAETLHYAGAPEGLETSLSEANARLVELAERERAMPYGAPAAGRELERARFAVAAWADEQMLGSPRADAAAWAAVSLQYRYFGTAEAGRLFYQELDKCFDAHGVPRRVRLDAPDGDDLSGDGGALDLESAPGPEREEWRALDIAERFDAAASMRGGEDFGALEMFALCLLCGFRGALYGDPAALARIRRSCRALFPRAGEPEKPPVRRVKSDVLLWVERAAYVALPLLVCLLFALYCGGVLANAPFRAGF